MRKPLLLLVDDDHAVLEAIEAELTPAFAEICRIEAFDDPLAVLASLPRWSEEQRSIAVAIVDQKMPAMTGVELLAALQQATEQAAGAPGGSAPTFHPTAHMRSILLTGYADLEVAVAAKNEAGADRYVEKPWRAEELHQAVTAPLLRVLGDSSLAEHHLFREVQDKAGLQTILRLRHDVYVAAEAPSRFVEQTAPLDVDAFDGYSRHYALCRVVLGGADIIGTLRVTGFDPAPALSALRAVTSRHPALRQRLATPRPCPLPMMIYLVDREAVGAIVEQARSAGEQIVEPGRLALRPDSRAATGSSERHLARHIIEGAVAFFFFFFFFFRIEHALLTCLPTHAAFYRPYGFRDTEGTSVKHHAHLGFVIACLHGRRTWVPSPARGRCEALAARIARTGAACRCATFPRCLGGPYESGDFRGTDLFCPLRASELLPLKQLAPDNRGA